MKLKNIMFIDGTIASLSKLVKQDLPITNAYSLLKLLKKIEENGKIFDEKKMDIYRKYGEEKNGTIEIIPEGINYNDLTEEQKAKVENVNKDLFELGNIEEEYTFDKISIKLDDKIKLSVSDLALLGNIIDIVE